MLSSQHAIIGGAVGLATGNPVLGFFAGVASHHFLDMLPHIDGLPEKTQSGRYSSKGYEIWPKSEYIIAYSDSLITLVIMIYIALGLGGFYSILLFLVGAIGGVFPDMIDNVPFWKKHFRKTRFGSWYHNNVHMRLHFHWHDAHGYILILTMVFQILVTVGGIWASFHV